VKCRCGDPAAQICACGREHCIAPGHDAKPRQVVHCATCRQPLCWWHFTTRPTVSAGQRIECHPSCSHALTGSSYLDYQKSQVRS